MPKPVTLNDHSQMRADQVPNRPELITKYIVDVPDPETACEKGDTGEESLDNFGFRGVCRGQAVYQVQEATGRREKDEGES